MGDDDLSTDDQPPAAQDRTVFISYARPDRARVEPLAAALTAAGYDVWWDALIDGGAAFATTIEERLAGAGAIVVVWSAHSVASDWVRDEAAHARDRKRLAPVTIDTTPPPLGFRQYHALDFSKWRGAAAGPEFQALTRCIDRMASGAPATGFELPRARAGAGIDRRAVIGGAAVLAAGGAIGLIRPWEASAARNSIAVLPFQNLSGDRGQDYFSDGLAEEIRAALARNERLEVAASTSSNTFRDEARDARSVARALGVAFLLEGSVRKAGSAVRVAADLIDAKTGFSGWSQSFDRDISDIFAVQSEIAATVSDALAVKVADPGGGPGSTRNVAAFDSYLRGRALFNSDAGEDSDRGALAQYDAAIAADPKFAAAHAARSRVLAAIASVYARPEQLRPLYDQAIAAAKRSIELAPGLAHAHLALAFALYTGRLDVKGARAPYDKAYALGGGDADILGLYALYCARSGRAEVARQAAARAVALDPLNPRAWRTAGTVAYSGRRYEQAITHWRHALKLNPKLSGAPSMIASALYLLGRMDEAGQALVADSNHSFQLAARSIVQHKLGKEDLALQAQRDLASEFGDAALYQQAQILAQRGEIDAAMDALEKARAIGDSGMLYMLTDPMLDPLRKSPRFSALLRAAGFV